MALLYIEKIPEKYRSAFEKKVIEIADKLGIDDPNWITIVMNHESGMNSHIENGIGCVGLIQFCPNKKGTNIKTIGGERINLDELKQLDPLKQLDYVYKYYYPARNKIFSLYDLTLQTFYPYASGKPDSYVFGSEKGDDYARLVCKQNKIFDLDKDGYISMKEYKQYISKLIKDMGVKQDSSITTKASKYTQSYWLGAVVGGALAYGMYLAYKHFVVKK